MTRAENVREARRLRDEGWLLREIAERMDRPFSTVHSWLRDPDLSKQRALRERYRGRCVDCGAPTSGANGRANAPKRCRPCSHAYERQMTRAWILRSIREWADEHGGIPPAATDWNPSYAIARGHPEKAEAHRAEPGRWPLLGTVQNNCGSWNAAIREAGYEPRPPGHYGRDGELWQEVERTADLYRDGLCLREVGEVLGISTSAVLRRLVRAGVPRRPGGVAA